MTRHFFTAGFGLVLAVIAVGFLGQPSTAGGKLDPVKVQASADKADAGGKRTVTVQITIDKGWHIYANPAENEEVAQAKTVVQVKAAGKAVAAKVNYPAGKLHKENGIGTMKIYEDRVAIQAEVPSADGPLEVSVRFQACDAKKCLLPKTVKISVP
jgi:uncharacterized protein